MSDLGTRVVELLKGIIRPAREFLKSDRALAFQYRVRRTLIPACEIVLGLSFAFPSFTMILGLKEIPNLILQSGVSIVFGWAWVWSLLVLGMMMIVSGSLHRAHPELAFWLSYIALPGISAGVLIYGLSAALDFGLISGSITLGITTALTALAIKEWLHKGSAIKRAARRNEAA